MTKMLFKFGQQQLVMVNYACGFNQSEMGKYFERFHCICYGYHEKQKMMLSLFVLWVLLIFDSVINYT